MFEINTTKKYVYLDLLRILAAFCVIMLHIVMPYLENQAIFGGRIWHICNILNSVSRAGVPLFFMISGFLLLSNEKTLKFIPFYKKRLSKILLPFLLWSVIYYVVYGFQEGKVLSANDFIAQMADGGTSYHFWFVYTLITLYLFMPFLKRILDSLSQMGCWWLLIFVCLKTTIIPFINTVTPIYIQMYESVMQGYVGFVILGYILGKYNYSKKQNLIFYAAGIIGLLMSVVGNYTMSEGGSSFIFNGGYQINHFMVAAALFILFKNIKDLKGVPAKLTETVAGTTFGMYLVHPMVISLLSNYITVEWRPYIYISVMFVLTSVISSLFALIVSKIKVVNKILL